VRTLIREGISAYGLIAHRPMFREHEDMSRELTLDVSHYPPGGVDPKCS
jgi:hypothetical protein